MNIYKIYFNHIIELLDKFKLDSNYNFENTEILKKITLEPPKNSINGLSLIHISEPTRPY